MTRNQQISDNAQYSSQLMLFYINSFLGSQTCFLLLFIKLIVLFSLLFISVTYFTTLLRSSYEKYIRMAFIDSDFSKTTTALLNTYFHDLKLKIVLYFEKRYYFENIGLTILSNKTLNLWKHMFPPKYETTWFIKNNLHKI